VGDAIDAVDNATSATKEAVPQQKEEAKPVKNDTLETLYYGGEDHTLQKTEKSVNGKIVKVEKND
jgi:hypothetical protein